MSMLIMQEEYTDGDELAKLECRHEFHFTCIKEWLFQKNECPICKRTAINFTSFFWRTERKESGWDWAMRDPIQPLHPGRENQTHQLYLRSFSSSFLNKISDNIDQFATFILVSGAFAALFCHATWWFWDFVVVVLIYTVVPLISLLGFISSDFWLCWVTATGLRGACGCQQFAPGASTVLTRAKSIFENTEKNFLWTCFHRMLSWTSSAHIITFMQRVFFFHRI